MQKELKKWKNECSSVKCFPKCGTGVGIKIIKELESKKIYGYLYNKRIDNFPLFEIL